MSEWSQTQRIYIGPIQHLHEKSKYIVSPAHLDKAPRIMYRKCSSGSLSEAGRRQIDASSRDLVAEMD